MVFNLDSCGPPYSPFSHSVYPRIVISRLRNYNVKMADNRLYELLGVDRNASDAEIKKNYRKLAKEFHPDKNPEAGDKFKEISYAYEIISDPSKRQFYDRHGLKGMQEGGGGHGDDFPQSDLLSHLFGDRWFGMGGMGGMGGHGMRRKQRGEDTVHPLKVSLEDMYRGKTVKLELSKNIICPPCEGRGGKPGCMMACRECKGRGIRVGYRSFGPGLTQQIQSRCTDCAGQGKIINEKDRCGTCKGKKVMSQKKILEVHVDKGMKENQKIYFRGEGDQQPDVESGDVIIVLQLKKHEKFQRSGDDLLMTHSITLTEALCGFNFVVKQLDGRDLLVQNAAGQVIKPGDVKGVPGEGMPQYKNPFKKGNLYIKFEITFPENNFQSVEILTLLETYLPPRQPFAMPIDDDVEEVDLSEYYPNERNNRREAYASDESQHYGHGGGPGLQCAHQ